MPVPLWRLFAGSRLTFATTKRYSHCDASKYHGASKQGQIASEVDSKSSAAQTTVATSFGKRLDGSNQTRRTSRVRTGHQATGIPSYERRANGSGKLDLPVDTPATRGSTVSATPSAADTSRASTGGVVTARSQGGWGRSSGRPLTTSDGRITASSKDPFGLRDVRNLVELDTLVQRHVRQWLEGKNVVVLRAAFYKLASLPLAHSTDPGIGRRTLESLSDAYLQLQPQVRDAYSCVAPMYACAKLGHWGGDLPAAMLARLSHDGAQMVRVAKPQEHSILWWAVSAAPPDLEVRARGVLDTSAARLQHKTAEQLKSQEWSNVLLACARLQYGKDAAFLHHVTACLAAKQDTTAQTLANTFYSLGKLVEDCGHAPAPADLRLLSSKISVRLELQLSGPQRGNPGSSGDRGFNPQELANMLLGCAKLEHAEPSLLRPLAAAAAAAAPRMSSQEVSNSVYALAKLGCSGQGYAPAIQQLLVQAQRLCDQVVARQGLRDPSAAGLVTADLVQLLVALEWLRPPGWKQHATGLAAVCKRFRFHGFGARDLGPSVWALAKMDTDSRDKDWPRDQGLYAAAVEAAMRPGAMVAARSQCWSNLLYGLALVGHRPDEGLLRAMAGPGEGPDRTLEMLRATAESQHCANLLWALANLGLYEQRLVDALAQRLGGMLRGGGRKPTKQELANSLWALAVMGPGVLRRHSGLVEGLLREAVALWEGWKGERGGSGGEGGPWATEELAQLWQVQLELQHAAIGGRDSGLHRILADARSGSANESFIAAAKRQGTQPLPTFSSHFQREVLSILERLTVRRAGAPAAVGTIESNLNTCIRDHHDDHRNGNGSGGGSARPEECSKGRKSTGGDKVVAVHSESLVEVLGTRVDVLVEMASGRRVAVEADGPLHFLANPPHNMTRDGPTRLRDRQLERVFGRANVLSVPHWRWRVLQTEAQRVEYMADLLGLVVEQGP